MKGEGDFALQVGARYCGRCLVRHDFRQPCPFPRTVSVEEQFRAKKAVLAARELEALFERMGDFRLRVVQRLIYTRMGRDWRAYECWS